MNPITRRIATAICANDFSAYQRERHPAIKEARVFSKTRRTILTLTTHQHFPSEISNCIKRIIFAQQFAFRYPSDVMSFPGLGS